MPEVTEFDTQDEAIAAAMADLDVGGIVTIHADDCGIEHGESEDDCTCEPITLIKGAEA